MNKQKQIDSISRRIERLEEDHYKLELELSALKKYLGVELIERKDTELFNGFISLNNQLEIVKKKLKK